MPIRSFKKKPTTKKYSPKSKGAMPARLRGSKAKYSAAKTMSKALTMVGENKIIGLTQINEAAPSTIQPLAIAYQKMFVVNSIPTGWPASATSLGGVSLTQGTSAHQRVGNYVYLKKTHITMEVEAQPVSSDAVPVPKQYRVIVFKQRRSNMPTGRTVYPQNTLFLDEQGDAFGHATSGKNGSDLMLQPLNKRDWVIYKDIKFSLTNPQLYNENGSAAAWNWTNQKYGSYKKMVFNLPHYAKANYDNTTNVPEDLDTFYGVVVYAKSLGKDYAADDWEVNLRGSTIYSDN